MKKYTENIESDEAIENVVEIEEDDEVTIKKIKLEFLNLLEKDIKGYYIPLEKVYTWLDNIKIYNNYANNEDFRENFRKRILRNKTYMLGESKNENDKDKDFIMRKINNISFPYFSTVGFKTFCMMVKETKSYYVRKYFIQVEEDYLRVLKQPKEETDKERKKLFADMEKFELRHKDDTDYILKVESKLGNAEMQLVGQKARLKNSEQIEVILEENEGFESTGTPSYKEYLYMKETYMKKAPLYIVDCNHVNKISKGKGKATDVKSEPKIEPLSKNPTAREIEQFENANFTYKRTDEIHDKVVYDKPYNEYNFEQDIAVVAGSGDYSPTLFYFIGNITTKELQPKANMHKVTDLYVHDKDHLETLKRQMSNPIYESNKDHIYNASYDNIIDKIEGITMNRYRHMLSDKTKKIVADSKVNKHW